jgi:hypothetical protein
MIDITAQTEEPKKCKKCSESKIEEMQLLKETRILEKEVQSLAIAKYRYTNKLKQLQASIEKLGNGRLSSQLPAPYLRKTDLLNYYLNLKLPTSLFQIIRRKEDTIAYMLQSGMYIPLKKCFCGKAVQLTQLKYEDIAYLCQCGASFHMFESSVWERFHLIPEKILLFMFLWLMGQKLKSARQLVDISKEKARMLEDFLLELISEHFVSTFEKFHGIVEIDESCFKHTTTSRSRSQPERWVFGLYEREGKRNYMEVVQKRTSGVLIPIIQKVCEPGTTIVSDQWAAYNKLSQVGFPHYTVDHSRFFVNPTSREIHTQNIELSWCWAKFEIKRQNRGLGHLQQFLHVYCWKRQFKSDDKINEIGLMWQEVCGMIKRFQENGGFTRKDEKFDADDSTSVATSV